MRHDEDGANGDEDDGVVGLAVVVAAVDVGAGAHDGPEMKGGETEEAAAPLQSFSSS